MNEAIHLELHILFMYIFICLLCHFPTHLVISHMYVGLVCICCLEQAICSCLDTANQNHPGDSLTTIGGIEGIVNVLWYLHNYNIRIQLLLITQPGSAKDNPTIALYLHMVSYSNTIKFWLP